MVIYHFDPDILREHLYKLSIRHQLAFAASCCERLLPNYRTFEQNEQWGNYDLLRSTLNEVWLFLLNSKSFTNDFKKQIEKCESAIPDTEEFTSIYVSFALDASAAIVEALKFIVDSKLSRIIDIASFCRDTVDLYIQEQEGLDYSNPEFEREILTHPLMVQELKKQKEDLEYLQKHEDLEVAYLHKLKDSVEGKSSIQLLN